MMQSIRFYIFAILIFVYGPATFAQSVKLDRAYSISTSLEGTKNIKIIDYAFGTSGEGVVWVLADTIADEAQPGNGYGGTDIELIKVSGNGNVEFARRIGTEEDDHGVAIRALPDGGVIVLGIAGDNKLLPYENLLGEQRGRWVFVATFSNSGRDEGSLGLGNSFISVAGMDFANGYIYVAGTLAKSLDSDGSSQGALGYYGALFSIATPELRLSWSKSVRLGDWGRIYSISTNSYGIVLAGQATKEGENKARLVMLLYHSDGRLVSYSYLDIPSSLYNRKQIEISKILFYKGYLYYLIKNNKGLYNLYLLDNNRLSPIIKDIGDAEISSSGILAVTHKHDSSWQIGYFQLGVTGQIELFVASKNLAAVSEKSKMVEGPNSTNSTRTCQVAVSKITCVETVLTGIKQETSQNKQGAPSKKNPAEESSVVFYMYPAAGKPPLEVNLYAVADKSDNVELTVDWGDGEVETLHNVELIAGKAQYVSHIYDKPGKYRLQVLSVTGKYRYSYTRYTDTVAVEANKVVTRSRRGTRTENSADNYDHHNSFRIKYAYMAGSDYFGIEYEYIIGSMGFSLGTYFGTSLHSNSPVLRAGTILYFGNGWGYYFAAYIGAASGAYSSDAFTQVAVGVRFPYTKNIELGIELASDVGGTYNIFELGVGYRF